MKIKKTLATLLVGAGILKGIIGLSQSAIAQEYKDNPGRDNNEKIEKVETPTSKPTPWVEIVSKTKRVGTTSAHVFDPKPVIQTTVGIDMGNYSFDIWHNYSTERKIVDEVDLEASYTPKFLRNDYVNVGFDGALFFISDPKDIPLIGMVKATVSPKTKLPVDVKASVRKLFGEGDDYNYGSSLELRAGKSYDLGKNVSASVSVGGYFNDEFFSEKSGFSHINSSISLRYPLKGADLSASINSNTPSSHYRDELDDEVWGQIGISKRF